MRRPLFAMCLCLVILSAVRFMWSRPGEEASENFHRLCSSYETLTVTGQVYQKDSTAIFIKDVKILDISNKHTFAASLQQANPNSEINTEIKIKNLLCELTQEPDISLGTLVAVEGNLYGFPTAANPGEFDAKAYYETLGISGKLTKASIVAKSESAWPFREGLYRLKENWRQRLYRIFPEKEASVMSAMLLGERTQLDKDVKALYKRSGIIHILSISGLHITLIGMGIYKILRRLGMPGWLAALLGGFTLCLYGIMTGLGVSACRAIGMYLIRMLGEAWGRTYDMVTALGVSGAVTVLNNPLYLQHAGFWLSYMAVLGVGALLPCFGLKKRRNVCGIYENHPIRSKIRKVSENFVDRLKKSICGSASITAATLPMLLWFYHEAPTYSVFLNLLVLPFMPIVMAIGMLAMLIPGVGWLGKIDCLILSGYEFLCRLCERLPFSVWNPGKPQMWQIAVYYMLLLAGMAMPKLQAGKAAWTYRSKRLSGKQNAQSGNGTYLRELGKAAVRFLCFAGALLVLCLHSFPKNKITFLDVGQGDCICIQTKMGNAYLFDCGSTSRSLVGKYVLLPFLKHEGIRHLTAVFVSHSDTDHVSGILELLEEGKKQGITVGALVLPDISEQAKQEEFGELLAKAGEWEEKSLGDGQETINIQYIKAGDVFYDGDFRAVCLHPPEGYSAVDANGCSQCFYVEFENGDTFLSLLLTGDVEGEGEKLLLKELEKRNIENITILKAAHHGSRNSTGSEMLQRLRPAMTLISCGKDNSYGHPHKELLERLEEVGTCVLKTPETGAVTVTCRGEKVMVETYLRE